MSSELRSVWNTLIGNGTVKRVRAEDDGARYEAEGKFITDIDDESAQKWVYMLWRLPHTRSRVRSMWVRRINLMVVMVGVGAIVGMLMVHFHAHVIPAMCLAVLTGGVAGVAWLCSLGRPAREASDLVAIIPGHWLTVAWDGDLGQSVIAWANAEEQCRRHQIRLRKLSLLTSPPSDVCVRVQARFDRASDIRDAARERVEALLADRILADSTNGGSA